MWTVHAKAPSLGQDKTWDFKIGFFPRKVHYKATAELLAKEAIEKGGSNVYIVKDKK